MALVTEHAIGKSVCGSTDAIVELGQRVLVASGDERHQGLVREVGVLLSHGEAFLGPGQR